MAWVGHIATHRRAEDCGEENNCFSYLKPNVFNLVLQLVALLDMLCCDCWGLHTRYKATVPRCETVDLTSVSLKIRYAYYS